MDFFIEDLQCGGRPVSRPANNERDSFHIQNHSRGISYGIMSNTVVGGGGGGGA